jgi:hypothetical protein
MQYSTLSFFIFTISALPAFAKCPPGYVQQQRLAIKSHYQEQIAGVNNWRDEGLRQALDSYKQEYYADSTELLDEWKQEKAELARQIRADDSGRANQKNYGDEARSIGKEYRHEIRSLRKDHSGKYWKEISLIREEARSMREALHESKAEDIAQLNLAESAGCKTSSKSKLRSASEWISEKVIGNKKKDDKKEINGVLGTRG